MNNIRLLRIIREHRSGYTFLMYLFLDYFTGFEGFFKLKLFLCTENSRLKYLQNILSFEK